MSLLLTASLFGRSSGDRFIDRGVPQTRLIPALHTDARFRRSLDHHLGIIPDVGTTFHQMFLRDFRLE